MALARGAVAVEKVEKVDNQLRVVLEAVEALEAIFILMAQIHLLKIVNLMQEHQVLVAREGFLEA